MAWWLDGLIDLLLVGGPAQRPARGARHGEAVRRHAGLRHAGGGHRRQDGLLCASPVPNRSGVRVELGSWARPCKWPPTPHLEALWPALSATWALGCQLRRARAVGCAVSTPPPSSPHGRPSSPHRLPFGRCGRSRRRDSQDFGLFGGRAEGHGRDGQGNGLCGARQAEAGACCHEQESRTQHSSLCRCALELRRTHARAHASSNGGTRTHRLHANAACWPPRSAS